MAALKNDGSVITWGNTSIGGSSSTVSAQLSSGVMAFADPFHNDRFIAATTGTALSSDPSPALALTVDTTAPLFISNTDTAAIYANSGANQFVYTAQASDASAVNYSLANDNNDDAVAFSIDARTGEIRLTKEPEPETRSSYDFTVIATDAAGNSSEQTVSLTTKVDQNKKFAKVKARLSYSSGDYYDIEATIDDRDGALDFYEGQRWNREVNKSWYTITSIDFFDGAAKTDLRVTDYYNRFTDSQFTPTTSEYFYHADYRPNFGTERGSITSSDGQRTVYFDSSSPITAYPGDYTYAVGKYHYGNGDFFTFSGFIEDQHGGGTNGGNIGGIWAPYSQPGSFYVHAEWTDKDAFDETNNVYGGYYEIEYAFDGFAIAKSYSKQGFRETSLSIDSYYSSAEDKIYVPVEHALGTLGLGSEKAVVTRDDGQNKTIGFNQILDDAYAPSYRVATPINSVDEGSQLTFHLELNNVEAGTQLFYEIESPSLDENDFSKGNLSDTVIYNGQDIDLTFGFSEDRRTEGFESFHLNLYASISNPYRGGETWHSKLAASSTVLVNDSSPDPTYTLSTEKSEYSESDHILFTGLTERVDPGTLVYWKLEGNGITSSDFKQTALSGEARIDADGKFQIEASLRTDKTTEGNETASIELYRDPEFANPVGSHKVSILDTSKTPIYSIIPSSEEIKEGDSIDLNINTNYVEEETVIFWKAIGTSISVADFTDEASGSFKVEDSQQHDISLQLTKDFFTEGTESFRVGLFSDSNLTTTLAISNEILIQDTSKTPTYNLSSPGPSVNEGETLSCQLQTTNLPEGHYLYWQIQSNAIDTSDLDEPDSSGIILIDNNGRAEININIAEDFKTEGVENLSIHIYSDALMTEEVAASPQITVNDISLSEDPQFFLTDIQSDKDVNLFYDSNGTGRLTDVYVNQKGETYKLFLIGYNSIVHGYQSHLGLATIAKYDTSNKVIWSKAFKYQPDDRKRYQGYADFAAKFIEEVDDTIYLSLFDSGYIFGSESGWTPNQAYVRDFTVALNTSDGSHQTTASNGYPQRLVYGTRVDAASSTRTSNSFNQKDDTIFNAGFIGPDTWITGYQTNVNDYHGYLVAHEVKEYEHGPGINWSNYIYTPQPIYQLTEDNHNGGTWGLATIDNKYAITKWDQSLNTLVEILIEPEARIDPISNYESLKKIIFVKALPTGLLVINGHQPLLIGSTGDIGYYDQLPSNFNVARVLEFEDRVALLGTESGSGDVYFVEINDATDYNAFKELTYIRINQHSNYKIVPGDPENNWSRSSASWDGETVTFYDQGVNYIFELRDQTYDSLRIGERDSWYVSEDLSLNHAGNLLKSTDFSFYKIERSGLDGFISAYNYREYLDSGSGLQASSTNSVFISQNARGSTLWRAEFSHDESLASTFQPDFQKTAEDGILFSTSFIKDVEIDGLKYIATSTSHADLLIGEISEQGSLNWAQQLSSGLATTSSSSTLKAIGSFDVSENVRVSIIKHRASLRYGEEEIYKSNVIRTIDDGFHNIALLKLDDKGQLLQSASLETSGDAGSVKAFEVDGNVYIYFDAYRTWDIKFNGDTIQSGSYSGDLRRKYIASIDENLNYRWIKALPDGDYTFQDFTELPDGNFAAIGGLSGEVTLDSQSVQSKNLNTSDVLIAHFRSDGTIYSAKTYGTIMEEYGYQIKSDNKSGFVIQGRSSGNWENSNEYWQINNRHNAEGWTNNSFFARVDADGNLLWTTNGFSQNNYSVPFYVRSDDSIVYHDNSTPSKLAGGGLEVISADAELGFNFLSSEFFELNEGDSLEIDTKISSPEITDHISLYWEINDGENLSNDFAQSSGYIYTNAKSVYGTDKTISIILDHKWSAPIEEMDRKYTFNIYESKNKNQLLTSSLIKVLEDQAPNGITLDQISFNENIAANSIVSRLSVLDDDLSQTHSITLVPGEGDSDNFRFHIEDNSLVLLESPDYEGQSSYSIRLRASDSLGLFVEEQRTLSVIDIPDPVRLEADGVFELWKDTNGYYYVKDIINQQSKYLTYGSSRYKAFLYGSTPIHADTVDGQNKLVAVNTSALENNSHGWHLYEYFFDDSWNFVRYEGHNSIKRNGYMIKDFYKLENEFDADFDGDGQVGHIDTLPTGRVRIGFNEADPSMLQASNNLIDPDFMSEVVYTWYRDGQKVLQDERYIITEADENALITVQAAYNDAFGNTYEIKSTPLLASTIALESSPDPEDSQSVRKPRFSGRAVAGSLIQIFADNVVLGQVNAGPEGRWDFDLPGLDGSFRIKAIGQDESGDTSMFASIDSLTIDTIAPTFLSDPNLLSINENSGSLNSIYVSSASDSSAVTYSLKAGNNDDVDAFSIDATNGEVVLTIDPDYESQSSYTFTVIATDIAGNASEQTVSLAVNDLDDTPPEAPSTPELIPASDSGFSDTDGLTIATTPSFTGIAEPGSNVELFASASSLGTTIADSSGNWAFTVEAANALSNGSYSITTTATDTAGNTSTVSKALSLTIDTASPLFTHSNETLAIDENSGANQIVYTAAANDTSPLLYSLKSGKSDDADFFSIDAITGEVTLGIDPDYEFQSNYAFTIVATDAAGNSSNEAILLTIHDLYDTGPSVANPIPALSSFALTPWSYTLPADLFFDPDSQLTLSVDSALPSWLSYNPLTTTFSGTPSSSTDSLSIEISAADDLGSVSTSLNLTVHDVQTIQAPYRSINYQSDSVLSLPLIYRASDNQPSTGLSFRLHYDSTLFSFSSLTNSISEILGYSTSADTADTDNDPSTNALLDVSIASFTGALASGAQLGIFNFEVADLPPSEPEDPDPVTGLPPSVMNLTASTTATGYGFTANPITLEHVLINLDVDGDGQITALGDGLMIIRKLFGAAFSGDALTNKAVSPDATRTTQEIHNFIQSGIDGGYLDVDEDGNTTALGDGLMVIRHLFGAAFAGDALTSKALSPNSPYAADERPWKSVAENIDWLSF